VKDYTARRQGRLLSPPEAQPTWFVKRFSPRPFA
jgi:hypothetical protein